MSKFSAQYYDGQTSKAYPIEVIFHCNHLQLSGSGINRLIPVNTLSFSHPVGTSIAIIFGPDDEEIHTTDIKSFDQVSKSVAPSHIENLHRFLETRYSYAIGALIFSIAFIAAGLRWGLPAFALIVANLLPADLEKMMGDQSLRIFDKTMMATSEISQEHQAGLQNKLSAICIQQKCPDYTLHFRKSDYIGANAFALPAGDIIINDDLIKLANNDEEILSVLFHELGHVEYQHSLRLTIQSAGAAALLVVITGDISTISDFAAGLPSLLMQSGYQRDMEREADAHALQMLKTACIKPSHFADIMTRLSKKAGETKSEENSWRNLLNSHPGTQSRIKAFGMSKDC